MSPYFWLSLAFGVAGIVYGTHKRRNRRLRDRLPPPCDSAMRRSRVWP